MELVKACLIANIVFLCILLVWLISMGVWFLRREKKHKKEKEQLQKSRDYHIKELEKRSGLKDEDLH